MKKISIIGGGISGLAVLHYLKKRFKDDVAVTLYERSANVGGTIASFDTEGFLFETGPNGFLTNQLNTLQFIEDLGFTDQLIEANETAKRRYIQIDGKLYLLPMDFAKFIQTPLLTTQEKIRFVQGFFKKNVSKDQSIYDYTSERFGVAVAERLVDPFLTGIYAGNIKRLHMSAFPKMATPKGQPKAKMCSFKNGMGSLIGHLAARYTSSIQTETEIKSLDQVSSDLVVCATPAYVMASLIGLDALSSVYYAPVAVVGLVVKAESFKRVPDGFGYLIPSTENKNILGVLIESNVYDRNTREGQIFIRVMMGGAHHPTIVRHSHDELTAKAVQELDQTYGLTASPLRSTVQVWPKGIPQYEMNYPVLRQQIREVLAARPQLRLCGNYLDGISFNDCINNARQLVDSIHI